MKALVFGLMCFGLSMFTFQLNAQSFVVKEYNEIETSHCISITLPIIGKAGVTIDSSGKVKVCPGWAWNKCATVTISFFQMRNNDFIQDYDNVPVQINVYDENEQVVDVLFSTGEIINSPRFNSLESLNELKAENILLK
jgi:hypothetical protein